MRKLRVFLAAALLGSSLMVVSAAPAAATSSCFNPDDPVCMIAKAVCDTTEPAAKYRDRVVSCYP